MSIYCTVLQPCTAIGSFNFEGPNSLPMYTWSIHAKHWGFAFWYWEMKRRIFYEKYIWIVNEKSFEPVKFTHASGICTLYLSNFWNRKKIHFVKYNIRLYFLPYVV